MDERDFAVFLSESENAMNYGSLVGWGEAHHSWPERIAWMNAIFAGVLSEPENYGSLVGWGEATPFKVF